MKILKTDRLILNQFELTDSKFILKLVNAPNWIEFIGDRDIKTEIDAEEYLINGPLKSYTDFGFGLWQISIKETKTPIGMCGLLKRDYLDHPDIGFAILPEYERNGYSYEAAKATLNFAKNNLKLKSILAITTEENIKSKNLLNKLGLNEITKIKPNKDLNELLVFST